MESEEVWAQRRREAQEKLANISLHSPEVLVDPVTWNNNELVEKWNQRRKKAQREVEEKRIQEERETERFVQALQEGKMSGPQKVKVEYVRAHKKMDQSQKESWEGPSMCSHPKYYPQHGKSGTPLRKRHLYIWVSKEAGQ